MLHGDHNYFLIFFQHFLRFAQVCSSSDPTIQLTGLKACVCLSLMMSWSHHQLGGCHKSTQKSKLENFLPPDQN